MVGVVVKVVVGVIGAGVVMVVGGVVVGVMVVVGGAIVGLVVAEVMVNGVMVDLCCAMCGLKLLDCAMPTAVPLPLPTRPLPLPLPLPLPSYVLLSFSCGRPKVEDMSHKDRLP